jgi:hypothetical protein
MPHPDNVSHRLETARWRVCSGLREIKRRVARCAGRIGCPTYMTSDEINEPAKLRISGSSGCQDKAGVSNQPESHNCPAPLWWVQKKMAVGGAVGGALKL